MLKNKVKIIALFLVILIFTTLPVVFAENETTTDETTSSEAVPISEDGEATPTETTESTETTDTTEPTETTDESTAQTTEETNNFKNGDVYLTGDVVTIDYVIDGNLFVFANTVNINSQIGGDVFAFAGTVNVGEGGYVFSNLFAYAKNVTVSGIAYDLYAMAETVTINGYVYRDIHTGSETLNINGVVGRNAYVSANNIVFATPEEGDTTVSSQGIINGDFNYTASAEISIPDGFVAGAKNFTPETTNNKSIQDYILNLGRFVVTVAIIWLLASWIAPKFLNNSTNLVPKKLLPVAGLGILTPIVIIALFAICILLGITATIALLAFILLMLLLVVSISVFVIAINQVICNKLNVEKRPTQFGILIMVAIVFWLISLVPYLGIALDIIAVIIGMGLVVYNVISKKEVVNKDTKKVEDKTK